MIVPYFLVFFFYLTPSPVKFYAIIYNLFWYLGIFVSHAKE